jgi:hypothetical protein
LNCVSCEPIVSWFTFDPIDRISSAQLTEN